MKKMEEVENERNRSNSKNKMVEEVKKSRKI